MKILAFASEAWETECMTRVLQDPATFGANSQCTLAVADTYLFQYESDFLHELIEHFPYTVCTLESRFRSWQVENEPEKPALDLEAWSQQYCHTRTLSSLINSNQHLAPWERACHYLPLSPKWREYIAADIIGWTTQLFDDVKPDVVLSIDRRNMPANIAQAIADTRKIPMLTLVPTRLGSRWIVRTDLGRGCSDFELQRIRAIEPTADELASISAIRVRLETDHPLYDSYTQEVTEQLETRAHSAGVTAIRSICGVLRNIASRHLKAGSRDRCIPVRRYDQAFWHLSFCQLRESLLRAWFMVGGFAGLLRTPPSGPYVLWMLHARPEESVSAVGDGLDESEEILWLRNNLPGDVKLVVKENALMLGTRRRGFYRALRREGISLVAPTVSSGPLIRGSLGLVGLSGTALLEALVIGKPALAVGHPEFEACLTGQGRLALTQFVDAIAPAKRVSSDELLPRYLTGLLRGSDERDIPFLAPLDTPQAEHFISSVAQRFMSGYLEVLRCQRSLNTDPDAAVEF